MRLFIAASIIGLFVLPAIANAQATGIVGSVGQSSTAIPSGAAGGDLGGTYPNPTVVNGSNITNSSIPNTGLATPAPCSAFGTSAGTCPNGGVITAGGPTGSATVAPIITYNAAGQLTTVSSATITPAIGSVTGLGTGVATALGTAVGSAGAPVVNGGALGTPSGGTVTNLTGTASININGTVGATTATTGKFTTLNATTNLTVGAGSAITSSGAGGALGSAAFASTGTSGATVPLLNGANTWGAGQTLNGVNLTITTGAGTIYDGSVSGSFTIVASSTGTPVITNIPSSSENEILCYNNSTDLISYASSVAGCVPSDPKVKNKGPDLNPQVALTKIALLDPGTGSFKPDIGLGTNQQVWLYADQVCAMDARLCVKDKQGILNYDKVGMLAYLVAAVKAQQQEIASLRNRWCLGRLCW